MENVHRWKPIVTTRYEPKEKMKKCLEYAHSILERRTLSSVYFRNLFGRSALHAHTLETMAQVGHEQAATRALAEAAQERRGGCSTHIISGSMLHSSRMMSCIAAEQDLELKLAERFGPCLGQSRVLCSRNKT